MAGDLGFFEVLRGTAAVRHLLPTPVPDALIDQLLEAAAYAPTGTRTQPWSFILLQSMAAKRFFADRYRSALATRTRKPAANNASSERRKSLLAAYDFAEVLHAAPLIVLVCGNREWPQGLPSTRRIGRPPPSLAATLPCAQNILLACHALGLGASLTTLHQLFEEELEHYLELPDDVGVVAAIPLGYPAEALPTNPLRPATPRKFYDKWGRKRPLNPKA